MNPSLGRNFEAMDPVEWLARLADHIPEDPDARPSKSSRREAALYDLAGHTATSYDLLRQSETTIPGFWH